MTTVPPGDGIDERFLLPLQSYGVRITFVPLEPSEDELLALKRRVQDCAIAAIKNSPDPTMYLLKIPKDVKKYIFRLRYNEPTFGFSIDLDDTSLVVYKGHCTYEEFMLTVPVIASIMSGLFADDSENNLLNVSRMTPFSVEHHFAQNFTLRNRLTNRKVAVTNIELMEQFFCRRDQDSGVSILQPDEVQRNEYNAWLTKNFDDRPASIGMNIDAPQSLTRKELKCSFIFERGDTPPRSAVLGESDFLEVERVATGFYRDMIVERLYQRIFHDLQVDPSTRY